MFTDRPLTTPVLFLIFNRPDTTQRVFDAIRESKPSQLFVSADGPREGKAGEAERCQVTRGILNRVDWECQVQTNFREKNVGLKTAISSGIDWFFENVEEGIILEDDCLPSQSFFWFCQELLAKYRDDERIMSISGDNFQDGQKRGDGSYYFSKLGPIWGWATWRRAWQYFDLRLETFPKFKEQNQIKNVFDDKNSQIFWITKIQEVYGGGTTWSFAWVYALFAHSGLCAIPNVNLVSNIGFGAGAVHATDPNSRFTNIERVEIDRIVHPTFVLPDKDADEYFGRTLASEQLTKNSFISVMKGSVRLLIGSKNYERLKSFNSHSRRLTI